MNKCECEKTKIRDEKDKKYILNRLKTIEGQIRGVSNMIDNDKYCTDVLTQLLAIDKSIKSLSLNILKEHFKTCVYEDIKNDKLDVIDEVVDLISKYN